MTLSRQLGDLTSAGATVAELGDVADVDLTGLEDGKVLYRDTAAGKWKAAWANPKDPTADLRDFMDARYGAGAWTGRTGVGAGTDAGPAIEDAGLALKTRYGRGVIKVPPKSFLVTTPPSAASLSGNIIEGMSSGLSCQLVLNNNNAILLQFTGASGYSGGGIKRLGLYIESGMGLSNSSAIYLQGDSSNQPDQFTIDDIYCTTLHASSYWLNGLFINGQNRTSPQGVRVGTVNNYQQFNCRNIGIGIFNAVQWSFNNIGTYTGTGGGNNIYVGGGGTTLTNSTQLKFDNVICSGELNLTNATRVAIQANTNTLAGAPSFDTYWADIDHNGFSGTLGGGGYQRFL